MEVYAEIVDQSHKVKTKLALVDDPLVSVNCKVGSCETLRTAIIVVHGIRIFSS